MKHYKKEGMDFVDVMEIDIFLHKEKIRQGPVELDIYKDY